MKLAKVAKNILAEDSSARLRERIAELEKERGALQLALDHSTEDYKIVVASIRKLSSECDQLKIHCDSLQAELAQARSDAEKHISNLEAKVLSAEARSIEIAAEGEKNLRDFQGVLVR
jgi:chromosome segregation ATPase